MLGGYRLNFICGAYNGFLYEMAFNAAVVYASAFAGTWRDIHLTALQGINCYWNVSTN